MLTWRVIGKLDDGQPAAKTIHAMSSYEARQQAEKAGMIVEHVEQIDYPTQLQTSRPRRRSSPAGVAILVIAFAIVVGGLYCIASCMESCSSFLQDVNTTMQEAAEKERDAYEELREREDLDLESTFLRITQNSIQPEMGE